MAAPSIEMGDNNTVILTQADGAEIRYTTDGTEPTTTSTLYSAPFTISGTTTVKAIAVKNGKTSAVNTKTVYPNTVGSIAEFISVAPATAAKINTPLTAIYQCGRNLYLTDGTDFILAYNNNNNADVTALAAQNGDVISFITGTYKLQAGLPELIPSAVGTKSAGTAVEPEEFTIEEIPSDQLSKYVKITGVNIVADAEKANNYTATDETGSITLYNPFSNASYYPDAITLPDGTTGNTIPEGENFTVYGFISVYTNAQGTTLQITPIKIEGGTVMETVATPVFTPASGSALKVGDEISISCETEGAKIYIAFDEEVPTAATGMEYTAPLSFSENCKINAIAVKEGMLDSDVASATYTLFVEGAQTAEFDFGTDQLVRPAGVEPPTTASTAAESAYFADKDGKQVTFTSGSVNLTFATTSETTKTSYPQWWLATKGLELRVYNGTTMTFSAGTAKISKITFTKGCSSSSWNWPADTELTSNPGTGTWSTDTEAGTKIWTAPEGGVSLAEFTFSNKGRIGKIMIDYVSDELQGIEDIVNDNANAPVEYYNLQGIRVNGENLTPGIYIRRQGSEVIKVLVK